MSDVTKTLAAGSAVTYRVNGIDDAGSAQPIGTPTPTVESGLAVLSAGPDSNTFTITAADDAPSVIRVDANANAAGTGATLSIRVNLNTGGGAKDATSLVLTEV